MKRIISLFVIFTIVFLMFFTFTSCGNKDDDYVLSENEILAGKKVITYAQKYLNGKLDNNKAYHRISDIYIDTDNYVSNEELRNKIDHLRMEILNESNDNYVTKYMEDIKEIIKEYENDLNVEMDVETITEEPTTAEPETEKPTEFPAKVEQAFKDSCETIDFKTLARNPDKYKGNNYKFTGEVIQVQEGWLDTVDLRINITKDEYGFWEDTIYATVEIPEGEDNILEDDIITFWGTCEGEYTYTSVVASSVTLPEISIKYYELVE